MEILPVDQPDGDIQDVQSPTRRQAAARAERRKWKDDQNTTAVHLQWASSRAETRRLQLLKLGRGRAEGDDADPPDLPPPKQYCCTQQCCEAFPPTVVATIRAAHKRLLPGDQRQFYSARIHISEDNLQRQRHYTLDDPAEVAASLPAWWSAKAGDPVLQGGRMVSVCGAFFAWVLTVSRNRLYQPTMVVLSFLPVGHTHEDIDQMFSKISMARHQSSTVAHSNVVKLSPPPL